MRKIKSMQFTTVTPFSKILAGVLFILLPFLGFYLGTEYGKVLAVGDELHSSLIPADTINNVQLSRWKTYTNASFGFRFQYPSDWIETATNNGQGFLSPDHAFLFNVSGPYPESINQLVSQESTGSLVVSKTQSIFLGHLAIEEELLTPNGNTWNDSMHTFIGNVKTISVFTNGSPDIEYKTIVPGLTIMDTTKHNQGVRLFHRILATMQLISH